MKIVIVEDDRFFQKFYATKLRESKFEVETASDGEEGLVKIREVHPDLILLDLVMPKKDGFEVLKSMQNDNTLKNIPVLVFSTLAQNQDIERAKSLGADDYVNKSFFDFDTLLQRINRLIKK